MWDGFNQRKFPRLNLECQITIARPGKADSSISGKTENVGVGGVCLIQNTALERFSTCRIRLDLSRDETPVECDARVVWAIPRKDPAAREPLYDTGIEFVNLPAADMARVRRFIEARLPKGFERLV